MVLQKPLISICIDGKEHSWFVVAENNDLSGLPPQGKSLEHRWCQKCGCLTQVGFDTEKKPVVAVNDDGTPHLDIPKILAIITR